MAALARQAPAESPVPTGWSHSDAARAPESGAPGLLRFITCGSVDDGKSTLIGRMLYEAGAIPDDQLAALDGDSRKFGTQGPRTDFALLVDGLSAEREQGITIDVAYRYFATGKRSFIVADTPGHEQYTRNMATGASGADLAIILIDARKGVLAQTRRHSFIVSLVGVRHVVVAVNKMDLVGWDEAAFGRIVAQYQAATRSLGFASIRFVPVSARDGENVTTGSQRMPWYRGPALLPMLETAEVEARSAGSDGFVMPVQWVNRPDLDFRGYAGTPARGTIRVGDAVLALPSGRRATVGRLIGAAGEASELGEGQPATLVLTGEIDVSRGDVLVAAHAPVPLSREIAARLLWTAERPLAEGGRYLLKLATQSAAARLTRLRHTVQIDGLAQELSRGLAMNGIGAVTLRLDRPLVALPYAQSRELGGFILIDAASNETVAFGFVEAGGSGSAGKPDAAAGPGREKGLRRALARVIGRSGTPERRRRLMGMSWRLVSAAALFSGGLVLTGRADLSAALALGDLALRPLLRRGHGWLWRRSREGALEDGAGI